MPGLVTAELGYREHGARQGLVFKSDDLDPRRACYVPHCAFRDGSLTAEAVRVGIEARILAAFAS
jgi:hypothetical protein